MRALPTFDGPLPGWRIGTARGGLVVALVVVMGGGCGGNSAATPTDAGDAATTSDTTTTPDLGGVHSSCPTDLAGPELVRVGWGGGVAFCIDSTEVTNAQYQKFLTAAAPPIPGTRCQWNTSLAPSTTAAGCQATFDPVGRADHPVVCVDWCDAEAYCHWAGKHLCRAGSLDGTDPGPVTNPLASDGSEWVIACTNDHATTYPYGNEPKAGKCVDKKFLAEMPGVQPVKAATECVGGIAGVYDMAGNASEWQNDCVDVKASADGKDDKCDAYGGAQSSDYPDTACLAAAAVTDTAARFTRAQVASDNGFRCCADAAFF